MNPCWESSRACLVFLSKHEGCPVTLLLSFLVPEQCETYLAKVKSPAKCGQCCQVSVLHCGGMKAPAGHLVLRRMIYRTYSNISSSECIHNKLTELYD